ncbi:uncharacterized protein AB675_9964 [Cyphellophora attinorum]|uniref:Metallo-beta-lactamase domain-containing protein n=1 Tax=Cyphellophora attinorum TaxID=1664694 RepID=A0A0N0NI56_9EURO|nr:uncharacterized protein AB675_9964 [Phialophora attinorum]KPI35338.1 hypothetical protein AB675_9964 [Phialophora attinorum]
MATPPPPLKIPESTNTVQVYIIDTTSHMCKFPAAGFVEPTIAGYTEMDCCDFAFLIEHPKSGSKYDSLLFDLGVRKDWEKNSPDVFLKSIRDGGCSIVVQKDVSEILQGNGKNLAEIGGIIWSHWHFDHTENPRLFPSETDVIVGPGFKEAFTPCFPTVPDFLVDERLWQGRTLRVIDFGKDELEIGRFRAFDFYGDGSFYLLDAPGHTVGHMSALARTTADPPTFVLMGGDIAHHAGEFRPTQYLPIPKEISPNPVTETTVLSQNLQHLRTVPACPGEVFVNVHPKKSSTEPFFNPTTAEGAWHLSAAEATRSIVKMGELDAYDSIFPVIAHDNSLMGVVDLYPKPANNWKAKRWKSRSIWTFLGYFHL